MKHFMLIVLSALMMVTNAQASSRIHQTKYNLSKARTTQRIREKKEGKRVRNHAQSPRKTSYTYGSWDLFKEGTCSYTYSLIWSSEWTSDGLTIYARTSNEDPDIRQFKITNWQSYEDGDDSSVGVDLVIDYDAKTGLCHVAETYADYEDEDYGKVYAADYSNYPIEGYDYDDYPCTFDSITGHFSLYLIYYDKSASGTDAVWNMGEETAQVDGYPSYDLTLSLGTCTETNNKATQLVNITCGENAPTYKYYVVKEKCIDATIADSLYRKNLIDATYPLTSSTAETISLTFDTESYYTLYVGNFDSTGVCMFTDFRTFRFSPSSNWHLLGTFDYTDDILISSYGADPETYEVEVYEHNTTPRLFRMKNPYGAANPYNEEGTYNEDYYIEIHAEDTTAVYVDYQPMGADWGYGDNYISSMAALGMDYGMTLAEAKTAGYTGTYTNNEITFPDNMLLLEDADGTYYANTNGSFSLRTAATPEPTPGTNLVSNGDFETWTSTSLATGWGGWQITEKGNTGNAATTQSTDAHGGNYAVLVTGSTSNMRLGSEKITLKEGTYNVTFYAKASESTATIKPGYAYLQDNGNATYNYGDYAQTGISLTTAWTKVAFSFTLSEETDVSMVVMVVKKTGSCIVDDYTLCLEGEEPEPEPEPEPTGNIYSIDFTAGQGEWTINNITLPDGVSYVWKYDSNYGMKASAYVSKKAYETESWIVSPLIDCGNKTVEISVNQMVNHCTTPTEYLGLYVSTDKTNWTEVSLSPWPAGNSWDFVDATATVEHAGKVYFGFQYTSDTSVAATWEVKTFTVATANGINEVNGDVNANVSTDAIYNLAGQKVDNNYKGIVIINNHKILR